MTEFIKPFERIMDRAWLRDGNTIHTGEALVLACLLHVKKERTVEQEEELKEILDVYKSGEKKHVRKRRVRK